VNNNFIRPNQHKNNNQRNRNRNRRNTGSGSGGGGSGNNKVFDSNGPDIKLRGTTQTVAEKYMQLGRDAQSSGDSVMAENYYQHAEHYYRLWAASQPAGHSLQMSRRLGEEELDDESDDQAGGEEEGEAPVLEAGATDSTQPADGNPAEGGGEGQQRNFRNNNRDNNNRNFRPRWQNNRGNRNNEQRDINETPPVDSPNVQVDAPVTVSAAEPDGQWEAPSFLQKSSAAISESPELNVAEAEQTQRKPRTRRPRVEADVPVDEGSSSAE
jgi:Domain of unknown function (DUF4167)